MAKSEQAEVAKKKERMPCVGDMALWYSHGLKNQDPAPGLVVESQNGVLSLLVFSRSMCVPVLYSGVRQVGCKAIQDNPQIAVEVGGWDWTESQRELHAVLDSLS